MVSSFVAQSYFIEMCIDFTNLEVHFYSLFTYLIKLPGSHSNLNKMQIPSVLLHLHTSPA